MSLFLSRQFTLPESQRCPCRGPRGWSSACIVAPGTNRRPPWASPPLAVPWSLSVFFFVCECVFATHRVSVPSLCPPFVVGSPPPVLNPTQPLFFLTVVDSLRGRRVFPSETEKHPHCDRAPKRRAKRLVTGRPPVHPFSAILPLEAHDTSFSSPFPSLLPPLPFSLPL